MLSTSSCVFLELVELSLEDSESDEESDDSDDESVEEDEEDELPMLITSASIISVSSESVVELPIFIGVKTISSSIASLSISMLSLGFLDRAAPSAYLSVYASRDVLSMISLSFFCFV